MPVGHALDEIKSLIERFSWPMLASRDGKVAAVNRAWLTMSGYAREEAEGRAFTDFVPAEERRRLADRSQQRRGGAVLPGGPMSTQLLARDGRIIELLVDVTVMPALEGEPYAVSTLFREREREPEMDFALLLVETSAGLVSARTADEARRAVLARFSRAGLWAGFFRLEGEALAELAALPGPPQLEAGYAREAAQEKRPVFGGVNLSPNVVYLPLDGEVLVIHGASMAHAMGVLDLFGKLVSSAMRSVDDQGRVSRQLTDTRLMLDLARITSGTLELELILDAACDAMVRLLDVANCHITPYDPQTRTLSHTASSGRRRDALSWLRTHLEQPESLSALVARTRMPVVIEDTERTDIPFNRQVARDLGERALLGLPLVCRDELMGVAIIAAREPRRFPPQAIERAQAALGHVALCMANARLYSSLRQSYAELADTRAEMLKRERLAGLGELAAIVAHEVRNPLGAIFNAVTCLAPFVRDEPDPRQLMEILRQESERLNTLVTDLLHYARPPPVELQPEALGGLLNESLSLARLAGSERSVTVSCSVEPGLPRVPMDRRTMCQALLNVINNAVQAMPHGGELQLRAERERGGAEERVRIEVRDQGAGIAPEIAARIFEPFFTTKAQGTGLGLALVKRIVADHHGEITVNSEPGRGTSVVFFLPVSSARSTAA